MGRTTCISPIILLVLLYIIQGCVILQGSTKFTSRVCETLIKPGDFMLGGILSPYQSANAPCDGQLLYFRASYIESMAYAVDLINERSDILPNVRLGYEIRNNCFKEDVWTMLTMTNQSRNAEFA